MATGACSGKGGNGGAPASVPSSRPSSTAKIAIKSPHDGEVVHGSSVTVRLSLKGAKIVPATSTHLRPDRGHVHLYLDNRIISMTFGLHQDVPRVASGTHLLRAEFVASDHQPFDPRVFTQVAFEVKR